MADESSKPAVAPARRGRSPLVPVILLVTAIGSAAGIWYVFNPFGNPRSFSSPPGVVASESLDEARQVLEGASKGPALFFTVDPQQLGPREKVGAGPTLRDWKILSQNTLDSRTTNEVLSILTSEGTYADEGAKCFDPGLGFRFDNGFSSVELVICLRCRWVYAYEKGNYHGWALSAKGEASLLRIYQSQVPSSPK